LNFGVTRNDQRLFAGCRGVKEPVRTASDASIFFGWTLSRPGHLLRERVRMSAKNTVCVVSEDANLSNVLKAPFKSAGLNLISYPRANDMLEAWDPDKPISCVIGELRGGLEMLKELEENHCVVPVVLLAASGNLAAAVQATKAGAFDIVEKSDALAESAKKACAYYAKCQKLLEEKEVASERIGSLTRREAQVLNLMVEGKQNRMIAEELGISPKTLDIHRANLMDKMAARTTADMCRAHLFHKVNPTHLHLLA
jgi:two-component system response regulator FixJ